MHSALPFAPRTRLRLPPATDDAILNWPWHLWRVLSAGSLGSSWIWLPRPLALPQCENPSGRGCAPPPLPGPGPQPGIACPAGAVDISPGTTIQAAVNLMRATPRSVCRAGMHSLSSSITPKTGNTFVGEYGAILDGTGWTTTDDTQAAFRAHNQDIDYVTIRNLVIRNMPQRGIHAYYGCRITGRSNTTRLPPTICGLDVSPNLHHPEQLHPPQRGHLAIAAWRLPRVSRP